MEHSHLTSRVNQISNIDSGLFQQGIAVVMKYNVVVLGDTNYQLCALSYHVGLPRWTSWDVFHVGPHWVNELL